MAGSMMVMGIDTPLRSVTKLRNDVENSKEIHKTTQTTARSSATWNTTAARVVTVVQAWRSATNFKSVVESTFEQLSEHSSIDYEEYYQLCDRAEAEPSNIVGSSHLYVLGFLYRTTSI